VRLKPKSFSVLALSFALVWMFAQPTSIYAQKGGKGGGGGKGRGGGGMSQSRGASGGGMRGGMSQSRGMSGNSFRGGTSGGNSTRGVSGSSFRGGTSSGVSSSTTFSGSSNYRGNSTRSTGTNSGSNRGTVYSGSRPSYSGNGTYGGRTTYGGNSHSGSGDYDQGNHNHGGSYNKGGSYYGGRYSNYRPSYSQFYLGGGGLGYSYYGDGFGISIGLPLNRYYGASYYDNYNVVLPNYVESYPQPYYTEYVLPTVLPVGSVEVVDTSLAVPTPGLTVDAVGLSVIPASGKASEYQAQAEQAFREKSYQDAARLSTHAIIEDGENGKLHLFASQVFFAVGDYRASAAAVQRGAALLDRSEWGFVVENFREFYRGDEYVTQMDALVQFTKANPDLAYLYFLRGYQYKYLGHDEAARVLLARAVELESRDRLAADLLVMAGGEQPAGATPVEPVPVKDKETQVQEKDIPQKNPDSPPKPNNDSDKLEN
jgi:hypothetical protein